MWVLRRGAWLRRRRRAALGVQAPKSRVVWQGRIPRSPERMAEVELWSMSGIKLQHITG